MGITLQGIFREHFPEYVRTHRLPLHVHKAAQAIMQCRTAALGGHVQACPEGHVERVWYNSCKHRACPQCAHLQVDRWLEEQRARLLDCDHYHVVFTLPSELHGLWQSNPRGMADLLFASARDTLFELLDDERYLGAVPGVIATLHTWGRTLCLHPHVHCLVTGGGWRDGQWRAVSNGYLLPVRVVKAVFRGKLLDAIRQAVRQGRLALPEAMSVPQVERLLNRLGRKSWNVRIEQRYAHGRGVVSYLARYLKGGPLGNHRLLAGEEDGVTFRYTDHRDGVGKQMRLSPEVFLARLLQHVPEPGMHGVRYFGLYGQTKRETLARCRERLGQPPVEKPVFLTWQAYLERRGHEAATRCAMCGAPLVALAPFPRGGAPPLGNGSYAQAA
jgi:Putative transposase/Transposase zinc-binding domain